jgi:YegS/Rv2252/BmrU family lipid kinase
VRVRNVPLIVNPCSGRGTGARLAPAIVKELHRLGVDAEMRLTHAPRHAIDLVVEAVRGGAREVLVAGGDGTIFEAVNGMRRAGVREARLGIIPIGTGNDFVKMLQLADWRVACARIAEGRTREVDLGRCGEWCFANGVGIGFDAQVAHLANQIGWLTGTPVYALALVKALVLHHRTPAVRIEHEGGALARRITLIAIANGRCYGGAFVVAPGAALDDGLLELVVADAMSRLGVLGLVPKVLQGNHLDHPAVSHHRVRRVTVRSEEPLVVHADGEILALDAREVEVEMLPAALSVFA